MYIDDYQNIIDPMQKYALEHFLAGEAQSIELGESGQAFQPYYVDVERAKEYTEILDSARYNLMQNTLTADLSALFSHANYVDSVLGSIKNQSSSVLNNVNNQIVNAYNSSDKKRFEILRSLTGFKRIFYDAFRSNVNMETPGNPLYDGYYPAMEYDETNFRMVVPSNNLFEYSRDSYGKKTVNVELVDRRGITIGPVNNLYPTSNAIDNSMNSYWAELILTDSEITAGYTSKFESRDTIPIGAVGVLRINMKGMKKYNQITISPFCEFPIYILGMYAVNIAANTMNPVKYIVSNNPSGDYSMYKPTWIDSTTTFDFAPTSSNAIVIIFAQPHYKKTAFRLPKGRRENYEIFNTIFSSTAFGVIDYSKFQTDRDLETTCSNIARTMVRESDLNVLHIENSDKSIETHNKLEYSYGAYDINIKYKTYTEMAQYISKPINTVTSIGQIALWTDTSSVGPYGHIEYSLFIGNNNFEVPIVPINDTAIYEYLSNDRTVSTGGTVYYKPRFQLWDGYYAIVSIIDPSYKRTNKFLPITKIGDAYGINITGIDTVMNKCVLKYPYRPGSSSISTTLSSQLDISKPANIEAHDGFHPKYIDLLHNNVSSQMVTVEESITDFDANTNSITLKNTPFTQYVKDANGDYSTGQYVPIIVSVNNAAVQYYSYSAETVQTINSIAQYITGTSQEHRPYMYNCTDYKTRNIVYMESYQGIGADKNGTPTVGSEYMLYYQIIGNKIYFNHNFSGSTIVVKYNKLTDTVRLKSTIVSTTPGFGDKPPSLNAYALLMNDFDVTSSYDMTSDEFGITDENTAQGNEITIRPITDDSTQYTDGYVMIKLQDFKNKAVPIDLRRFTVINTGNISINYQIFVRATVITNNDPALDTQWTCHCFLVLPGHNPWVDAGSKSKSGIGKIFEFDANNGTGYPTNEAWFPYNKEAGFESPVIAPGERRELLLSFTLSSPKNQTQLQEAVLKVEFAIGATATGATATPEDITKSECVRHGPSYHVKYKCIDSLSAAVVASTSDSNTINASRTS